ncbi:hypothetical protein LQ948_04550 [Jiella sp. MQZ9-1]|uniref:Uncharacterized protein n=1 Tax=Jiella flava TaxID=2816857 RepID=A0A939JUW2_9HYPH|nr:hypothetical protein [Jiella flava]MBO0661834.1 hypothetical protein [Jiella flava]MCD2470474.1 hypothetical protein [Jiella flava]
MAQLMDNDAVAHVSDALAFAFARANERVNSSGIMNSVPLIDSIDQAAWDSWDATDENPIVCDSSGVLDLEEDSKQAA